MLYSVFTLEKLSQDSPLKPSTLRVIEASLKAKWQHLMDHSTQLRQLIVEFQRTYLAADGRSELATYLEIRNNAYRNITTIREELAKEKDCTDLILRKLLPYTDTANNRWLGAWTHLAAAVPGDIRRWYGAAGRTGQEDWPEVATAIWQWLDTIITEPSNLADACQAFSLSPAAKGFQMGMLTPILNGLYPEQFHLANNRTLHVLQYFTGTSYQNSLQKYPDVNRGIKAFLADIDALEPTFSEQSSYPGDLFERFCYWLTAVRQFSLRQQRYWLITSGEDAWQWEEWKDGRFVAMGYDEFGDISNIRKAEFSQRQQSLLGQYDYWTKKETNLVWRFARQLRDGDRVAVLAGDGDSGAGTIQGNGTVMGAYYYAPELPQGHRLPVQWDDIQPRSVPSDVRTGDMLLELTADQFESIQRAPHNVRIENQPAHTHWVPAFVNCFAPILRFLRSNASGSTTSTLVQQIQPELGEVALPNSNRGSKTEHSSAAASTVHQRERMIHRARYHLAKAGLIDSPRRGYWQVTAYGKAISLEEAEMVRIYEEVEYHRRVEESLHHESTIIRRLTESAMPYRAGDLSEQEVDSHSNGAGGNRALSEMADGPISENLASEENPPADGLPQSNTTPSGLVGRAGLDGPYTLADCAGDTGFSVAQLALWVRTLKRKRQVILTGPSGTGKTYLAHHLARHLAAANVANTAETDAANADETMKCGYWDVVQFHPGYAYEDFVQGLRPSTKKGGGATFEVKPGRFLEFCQRAKSVAGPAVLIIDEINRANLARVFGELMYLLEYRDGEALLASNGERFKIPANVYLIGTMNTADRSIALIDHAMRRRFGFIDLAPNYDVLRHFHQQYRTGIDTETLIQLLGQINHAIGDPNLALGITYFLTETLAHDLADIWQTEIEPTLVERFYDNLQAFEQFQWSVVQAQFDSVSTES